MARDTKQLLANALHELLSTVPLDKLTVQTVAEYAGVSRKTFYYYYQDLIDLVDHMLAQRQRELLPQDITPQNWKQALVDTCRFCQQNRAVVLNISHSLSRDVLENYLYHTLRPIIPSLLGNSARYNALPEERRTLLADMHIYALQGVLLHWLEQEMRADPEKLVENLAAVLSPEGLG